ncbi:MAG: glutamate-1-semialdehyde-2,1-aminomutase [Nitrospirae bacterium]|nr:MAG: glutamate-1-semialdehyde-2,1-aminomutase [Nitrospirota bacterium]
MKTNRIFKTPKSARLFAKAKAVIPGGVNSPVRAFQSVGGIPLFIEKALGPYLMDADGHRFIDYVLSWGPMIVGHAHPQVIKAIQMAIKKGTSYGAPCEGEIELAKTMVQMVPSLEQVRLVNSGTEAVMSAVRVARAYTQRPRILKFEGCYHGHADYLLVKAGSGLATLGIPDSPGVPEAIANLTITAPYNDFRVTQTMIESHAADLAAVIIEPIAGNMGVVPPHPEFLPWLREITARHEILLIFDEVITGFRVHKGGAQGLFGIQPDLTCLGKIIGGGFPIGAYGGRKDVMQLVAPAGPVYQAGTLSGNPVAVAAGLETLRLLKRPGFYNDLEAKARELAEGLADAAKSARVPYYQTRMGSMLTGFFTHEPVTDYASAKKADTGRYAKFFHGMLKRGSYFAPSQFEATFLSTAHKDSHIRQTIAAARAVFQTLD